MLPEPPPLPAKEVRRFQYPLLSFILLTLALIVNFLAPTRSSDAAYLVGYRIGGIVTIIAIPVLFTWLLYLVFRLRKTGTAISAWILSGFMLLGQLGNLSNAQNQQRERNDATLEVVQNEIQDHQKTAYDANASIAQKTKAVDDTVKAIQQAGNQMSGDEGQLMRSMAAVITEMKSQTAEYYQHVASFETSPILQTNNIPDTKELDARIARITAFKAANEKMLLWTKSLSPQMAEAVKRSGVSTQMQAGAMQGFSSKYDKQLPLVLQMRALDNDLADQTLAALNLLKNAWGEWKHEEGKDLTFETDASAKTFNACIQNINSIAQKETELQQQLSQNTSN